ncbi:hypothetical protein Tco_0878843 [Tanacetum coccineum]|uniref:Uncharacterized protein n=1 Tax=Tanacetum coccineum TaxID=301880 RepID=A0ABQ5C1C2_9ASTR
MSLNSLYLLLRTAGLNLTLWLRDALYDAHTEIACLMLGSMTPELHRQFELHYPYDMIQELRSMFEKQAGVEKFDLIQSSSLQNKGGKTVLTMSEDKGYVEQRNVARLRLNGQGQDKKVLIPKPHNPKPTAKSAQLRRMPATRTVRRYPHYGKNCHVYLAIAEEEKARWLLASSSCGDLGLKEAETRARYLTVGYGVRAQVEAIGIYEIDNDDLVPHVNSIINVSNKRVKHNLDSILLWALSSCANKQRTYKETFPSSNERAKTSGNNTYYVMCPLRHVAEDKCLATSLQSQDDYSRYGYVYLRKQKPERYLKENDGLLFLIPPEQPNCVVARYAEFFEKRLISQEISGRAVDLEEIQEEEDTTPSEITSNIPQEVEGFEPPQEELIPIRRSERTHRAPNRLCLNVEVEEHSLGDLNEPTRYKAAMLDSESNKWIML